MAQTLSERRMYSVKHIYEPLKEEPTEVMDFDSLSVAESLVALSNASLKISCPTSIPKKHEPRRSFDNTISHDCSPTAVTEMWKFKGQRPHAQSECFGESDPTFYERAEIKRYEHEPLSCTMFCYLNNSRSVPAVFAPSRRASFDGATPANGLRYIGSYSPEARRKRIEKFLEKRKRRVWAKKVDYDVRKNFADSRLRVKGRFVKKEDEEMLCQLMGLT